MSQDSIPSLMKDMLFRGWGQRLRTKTGLAAQEVALWFPSLQPSYARKSRGLNSHALAQHYDLAQVIGIVVGEEQRFAQ